MLISKEIALEQLEMIKEAFGCDLAYYGNDMQTAYDIVELFIKQQKTEKLYILRIEKQKNDFKNILCLNINEAINLTIKHRNKFVYISNTKFDLIYNKIISTEYGYELILECERIG